MKDPSKWVGRDKNLKGKHYSVKKHNLQRTKQGFSEYDWWNAHSYLSFVIIGMLKKFIKDANGYPATLGSMEEWQEILEKMIVGFEACEADYPGTEEGFNAQVAVQQEGLALFAKWYVLLWD